MSKKWLMALVAAGSAAVLLITMGIGSVQISPADSVSIILNKLFGAPLAADIDEITVSILWKIRVPRALLSFIAGSGLAVSGVMMQSVLRNPLASPLTLGVSSGAALGASIAILLGVSVFGILTLPVFGLAAGLATVFLSLAVASRIGGGMSNNSIILAGMAFSLFANAMITIILAFSREQLQRIVYWQMGSFSMKTPTHTLVLFPVVLTGCITALFFARQMDIMTLGDEQAQTTGIDVQKTKWLLLSLSAVITGAVVSVAGIIGFLDLFTPHIARKLFGARHGYVLLASALLGGAFMALCDLAARTVAAPLELPVGAVTCAVGAPLFLYIFAKGRRNELNDNA